MTGTGAQTGNLRAAVAMVTSTRHRGGWVTLWLTPDTLPQVAVALLERPTPRPPSPPSHTNTNTQTGASRRSNRDAAEARTILQPLDANSIRNLDQKDRGRL